ncbi:growth arrest and DNA damage-inducible protein GADD45 beta-like [Mizuhopecten yessoensis]|uniref:growth arrest and DNA damage-inducible protein GADD45 beta-like n=1 Tax=Mizuhopecten yessoensis TaxID=6573 RepID=UPI000B45BF73|nr:growth arrest and DNA damage-inducible protein GADD45 beta-like [Mizuhopecten yessoensis]
MTLPDEYPEDSGALSKQVLHEVSRSLEKLLQDAQLEHRLTTGVYNCAEILQRCPDQVMLCILPDSGPGHDVTIDIEHTLIEAYCWENDVRVLKVGNAHVLNKVFNNDVSLREMKKVSRQQSQGVDFSCLLVKYPKEVRAKCEWLNIERFCNWCLKHDVVQYVDIHSPD